MFLFGQSAWKWFALEPRMPIFLQIWQSYGGSFLPRPSRLVRELRRFRERERDRPMALHGRWPGRCSRRRGCGCNCNGKCKCKF